MKYFKLLLLVTFITPSASSIQASELCSFPFTGNDTRLYTEDLKLLGKVNFYDDSINFLRATGGIKDAPSRNLIEAFRLKFKPIQAKFYKGEIPEKK